MANSGIDMDARKFRLILTAVVISLVPIPAAAQSYFSGSGQALEGDILSVSGLSIRLFGIDAPELRQNCKRNGETWQCGEEAKRRLQALVAGKRVECRGRGNDEVGRTIAICTTSNLEIGKAMVEQGWAIAFRIHGDDYVEGEARAKTAKLGIWTSEFDSPDEYRTANRPPEPKQGGTNWVAGALTQPNSTPPQTDTALSGCAIKGNRSLKGELIYHLPGWSGYDSTNAEQFFCSEAEARAAGYRRSRAPRWPSP